MEASQSTGLIESILFMENNPVDLSTLVRVTGLSRKSVVQAIENLKDIYRKNAHGIELVEIAGGYCFTPKRIFWHDLQRRYGARNAKALSRAALETLAIIAYSQPVTKADIESMRGVSAEGMIKLLMDRSLIREVGKKDAPGKPRQYGTTKEFLMRFRLRSIAELPKLDDISRDRFESYREA